MIKLKKAKFFPYGVHIPDNKTLTSDLKIVDITPPGKVYISMSQHIGAPATPVVNVGDKVKVGTLIGSANGAVSANVYSSVSGEVIGIESLTNGLNQKQTHVIIQNDFSGEAVTFDDIENVTPSAIVERVRLSGIVGLGGAGFPTAVKLSPALPVDTIVINGAECEPYLTCDYRLMMEHPQEVLEGVKLIARAVGAKNIVIGIEKNKPEAIKLFSQFDGISVVPLKKQYPMGSEKHLIYCTTGRKVPLGKMPFDVGVIVSNVKTALECYRAVKLNLPLTHIVMTVSGDGIENPKNVRVPLGTPLSDIISFCGGAKDGVEKIIAGGPMMGKALTSINHYTRKTDSGLLLLGKKSTSLDYPTNCINCARCAYNCPMRLMPMYIELYANAKDYEKAEKYGAMSCIECGTCAYNCPAKRPLVQSISLAKAKIKEMKNARK